MPDPAGLADRVTIGDTLEDALDFVEREGWGDGLPIVPPTPARVEAALRCTDRPRDAIIATLPPAMGPATVEKIAVNAVMAGCRPEYLPIVMAAVEGVARPSFNLQAVQVTTGPVGVLVVVNGPARHEIGLNCGYGALGPGNRANATIGRAVRLVLMNIGGGRPGETDMATLGQQGKFTGCFGENEERNPWAPLHVERGYDGGTSAVTVFATEAPINVNDVASRTAHAVLRAIATNMSIVSCNLYFKTEALVLLSPEHAALIAAEGWSKDDIKRQLHTLARVPLAHLSPDDVTERLIKRWPRKYGARGENAYAEVADDPGDVVVLVAGGGGRHSTYIPSGGLTRSATVPITRAGVRGEPA